MYARSNTTRQTDQAGRKERWLSTGTGEGHGRERERGGEGKKERGESNTINGRVR